MTSPTMPDRPMQTLIRVWKVEEFELLALEFPARTFRVFLSSGSFVDVAGDTLGRPDKFIGFDGAIGPLPVTMPSDIQTGEFVSVGAVRAGIEAAIGALPMKQDHDRELSRLSEIDGLNAAMGIVEALAKGE